MINKLLICFVAFCITSLSVHSRTNDNIQTDSGTAIADDVSVANVQDSAVTLVPDTIQLKKDIAAQAQDTVAWLEGEMIDIPAAPAEIKKFKPNPTKAVLYTAIFPGLGQIYNQKYWKLPIVYGGLVGLVYAITWNGGMYDDYTKGYRAVMKDDYYADAYKNDWLALVPKSWGVDADLPYLEESQLSYLKSKFKRSRDYFRRNRDLAIIGIVGLYAISMIDAYVDAELFDFDISPDLTFRVAPRIELDAFNQKVIAIQCNIIF